MNIWVLLLSSLLPCDEPNSETASTMTEIAAARSFEPTWEVDRDSLFFLIKRNNQVLQQVVASDFGTVFPQGKTEDMTVSVLSDGKVYKISRTRFERIPYEEKINAYGEWESVATRSQKPTTYRFEIQNPDGTLLASVESLHARPVKVWSNDLNSSTHQVSGGAREAQTMLETLRKSEALDSQLLNDFSELSLIAHEGRYALASNGYPLLASEDPKLLFKIGREFMEKYQASIVSQDKFFKVGGIIAGNKVHYSIYKSGQYISSYSTPITQENQNVFPDETKKFLDSMDRMIARDAAKLPVLKIED